jgi:hypothetical protein
MLRNLLGLALLLCSARITCGQTLASGPSASPVPTLIRVSSSLNDLNGKALSGPQGLTFAVYQNQEGGSAIWSESQTITPDSHGRYTAVWGSVTVGGIPSELFASGETQWIGVTPDDGFERPRIAITTVPYAFKAAEADTLGGKKPEEFVSMQQLTRLLGNGNGNTIASSARGSGTIGTSEVAASSMNGLLPFDFSGSAIPKSTIFTSGMPPGFQLVSNGVSQPPVYQSKAMLDLRDYGVTCSGTTDDTTAMQHAINVACNPGGRGKTLILPNSCAVKLTSTLKVAKCSGITLDGGHSQGQATVAAAGGAGSGNAALLWYGAVGGTVLEINQTRDSIFKNLTVFTNASSYISPGANVGIRIDEVGPVTNIVTNNSFEDIQVYNGSARNPNFIGIDICPSAPGNCESQNFTRVTMGCGGGSPTSTSNGIGIKYGSGGLPFFEYLHWYESAGCSKAIDVEATNILDIDGGLASGNYTDLQVNNSRNVSYRHIRSENAIAQIVIGTSASSGAHDLTVEENSFSGLTNSTTTISYPFFNTGGIIRLIKNDWDANSSVTPFGPTGSGNFVGTFDSQDNTYPNGVLCPVLPSATEYVSVNDGSTGMSSCFGGVTIGGLGHAALTLTPTIFKDLLPCNSSVEGSTRAVKDSDTNTWGAQITGGGSNHVLAYCDGTMWSVFAR